MLEIIPAILSNNLEEVRALLALCEPTVHRVQIDVIDGVFANNKTIAPENLSSFETLLMIDYHLMVVEPEKWIDRCTKGHADRIIGQIEKMEDQMSFVEGVRESGAKAGLALDLETPVSALNELALMLTDIVVVLSVQAGFGGQSFHEEALTKIEELNDLRDKTGATFTICDDGGISLDTIALTSAHGVDSVAVGKRIFHGNLEENIDHFKKAAKG